MMTWADFVVRGTLVLAAGFAASYAFGRGSAALRHFVWTAAFVALLALPLALGLGPKIAVEAGPMAPAAGATVAEVSAAASPVGAGSGREVRRGTEWAGLLGGLYLAGFLLVAARFVAGAVRTSRMVRLARTAAYAQAAADDVRRTLGMGTAVRALACISHTRSVGSVEPRSGAVFDLLQFGMRTPRRGVWGAGGRQ
jgi:hypothetical protein